MATVIECKLVACNRASKQRGYCGLHYQRLRSAGKLYAAPKPTRAQVLWSKINLDGPYPDASDVLVTAPNTRCWVWTGSRSNGRYGSFRLGTKTVQAHRAAYILLVGQLSDDLVLDHLCRNNVCVNPTHLEPVTQSENTLRGKLGHGHRAQWEQRYRETGELGLYTRPRVEAVA